MGPERFKSNTIPAKKKKKIGTGLTGIWETTAKVNVGDFKHPLRKFNCIKFNYKDQSTKSSVFSNFYTLICMMHKKL